MQYALDGARQWARETLRGHLAATTTPLLADRTLDEDGLRSNVDELLKLACCEGLYVNSVIGEVQSLTAAERRRVLEIVVDQTSGRAPIVAVIPGNVISEVVEAAHHAKEVGADLVMVWPPTFGYRTRDGVLQFIRAVAARIDIGFCLYASGLSEFGFRISISMLRSLLDIPHLCAVKEASMSLSGYLETVAALGDDLIISCPLDEYWAAGRTMLPSKAPDVLLGTSRPLYMETVNAPYLSRLRAAVNSGQGHEAELTDVLAIAGELHTRFLEAGGHNIALIKQMSAKRGLAAGPVRPPMSEPTPAAIREGSKIMRQYGLTQ